MNHWLVKSDPEAYSATDLANDGTTVWDGVTNALAQKHIRAMAVGDPVFVYHTGEQKAIVATARVIGGPRPDPKDRTGKLMVVDLEFGGWLARAVPLAEIRKDKTFKDLDLVRNSRLSVMPVKATHWSRVMELGRRRD